MDAIRKFKIEDKDQTASVSFKGRTFLPGQVITENDMPLELLERRVKKGVLVEVIEHKANK